MFIVRITVLVFRVEISDTVTLVLALVHAIHISPFSRCHYKIFNYRQRARVFCLENQDELSSFFALIYKFLTQKYIYFTFFITNCNYFFLKHASFSKISKVTIEFLVRNCTSKRGFQRRLEIFCKLFVPVSCRNHPFDWWVLINGRFVFQNGDYIFKLDKSSKNSTDRDCTHGRALR